jgi:hypothetical protein
MHRESAATLSMAHQPAAGAPRRESVSSNHLDASPRQVAQRAQFKRLGLFGPVQRAPVMQAAAPVPVVQRGVRDYVEGVAGSTFWFLKSLLWDMPKHVWRLVKHLTLGLGVTVFDMGAHLVRAIAAGFNGEGWLAVGTHLGRMLMEGISWPLKLVAKLLDLVAFGEAMDLAMQIIKINTRPMNGTEITEASLVFGNRIHYSQVRVDEFSFLNTWLFRFWAAFTTWHTVNWPRGSSFATKPAIFIHELTHIWQMERRGTQYIAEAPYQGGDGGGYIYAVDGNAFSGANGPFLNNARGQGRTIWDFNLEQQAEICRHYYQRLKQGSDIAPWQPFIDDIQGVNTMPLTNWVREPALLPWS